MRTLQRGSEHIRGVHGSRHGHVAGGNHLPGRNGPIVAAQAQAGDSAHGWLRSNILDRGTGVQVVRL